jgi:hypothetical protein
VADEHKIIDLSRQAAIVGAANLLEGYAKAKQLRGAGPFNASGYRRRGPNLDQVVPGADKASGQDKAEPSDQRDFLFDFLRLNAQYLNHLAQLGKQHRHIAIRALENLHSRAFERMGRETAALNFESGVKERVFELENKQEHNETIVRLECSPLRGPVTLPSAGVTFSDGTKTIKHCGELPLRFDAPPVSITMSVESVQFPLLPEADYNGTITVVLGKREKQISFIVRRRGGR